MTTASNDEKRLFRTPYSHLFRLLHWLLPAALSILWLTGLSLHATARPGWSLFSGVLPRCFWPGRVHPVHLVAAVAFASSLLAASWLFARRKRSRWRVTHLALLGGGLLMLLSGIVLLGPVGPPAFYSAARLVHALVGLLLVPVALVWHAVQGLGRYRGLLVPAFHPWGRPRWRQVWCFVPVPLVTACLVLNGLPAHHPWRDLIAPRIPAADVSTEQLDTLPWNRATPRSIRLANGIGFEGGQTEVSLRALHDGRELFLLAQWADPTEDRQYMPWKRTPDGWQHLMTNENDESTYYEDKFGLVFPIRSDLRFERFGCAIYCHLGGGRAYGYKGTDRLADVWHWKGTRTDPVRQVDDKYWSQVDFSAKDVGRHGDPKDGGGYKKNFSARKAHPDFLPDGPHAVKQGIIFTDHAIEYTAERAAEIPPGVIVPGIVASAAAGDRGEIACCSRHEAGRWRLYIRRKLDTGSDYDVRFTPGRPHPFGCTAFDHTSKRHAYSMSVFRLVLKE
jgi:hypothetical protein